MTRFAKHRSVGHGGEASLLCWPQAVGWCGSPSAGSDVARGMDRTDRQFGESGWRIPVSLRQNLMLVEAVVFSAAAVAVTYISVTDITGLSARILATAGCFCLVARAFLSVYRWASEGRDREARPPGMPWVQYYLQGVGSLRPVV